MILFLNPSSGKIYIHLVNSTTLRKGKIKLIKSELNELRKNRI